MAINVNLTETIVDATVTNTDITISLTDATTNVELTYPGPQGAKGDPGSTGPANTLAIGTVTGGTAAAATITGTAPNQTLNLTLPKGDKGDTGATGATGATGPKGDKGDTGSSGIVDVTSPITNTGTAGSAIIGIDQTLIQIGRTQVTGTAVTEAAGKALTAGTADYATFAGTASYATTSGTSTYGTFSGTATYATNSGTAVYATTAGTATYATTSGTSTYATNAGTATGAGTATTSGTASYATTSGTATYATTSGTAVYATTAGTAANISGTIAPTQTTGTAWTVSNIIDQQRVTTSVIETTSRLTPTSQSGSLGNGTLYLTLFVPAYGMTVSNLSMHVTAAGTDSGGTTRRAYGLFTVSGRVYTCVARTAAGTTIGTSTGMITRALDTTNSFPATYTLVAGTLYAFGCIFYNTGGVFASPQLSAVNHALGSTLLSDTNRLSDAVTSQTDLPTSVNGTVTGNANSSVLLYGRMT